MIGPRRRYSAPAFDWSLLEQHAEITLDDAARAEIRGAAISYIIAFNQDSQSTKIATTADARKLADAVHRKAEAASAALVALIEAIRDVEGAGPKGSAIIASLQVKMRQPLDRHQRALDAALETCDRLAPAAGIVTLDMAGGSGGNPGHPLMIEFIQQLAIIFSRAGGGNATAHANLGEIGSPFGRFAAAVFDALPNPHMRPNSDIALAQLINRNVA
jgi:hypothetical protein